MDTTAETSKLAESNRADQFIPVRKEDLSSALIKEGHLADPAERELFWRFARTLRTICHYEYSETLDRLRDDYYYFNPEVASHAAADRAKSDCAYDDLIRSLDKVLKDANFEELPHEEVTDAHRKRTVPVEVKAEHDDFREVRFYKRGRHVEQYEVKEWFGLHRGVRRHRACCGNEDPGRDWFAARIAHLEAPQDRSGVRIAKIFSQYRVRRSLCSFPQCASS